MKYKKVVLTCYLRRLTNLKTPMTLDEVEEVASTVCFEALYKRFGAGGGIVSFVARGKEEADDITGIQDEARED